MLCLQIVSILHIIPGHHGVPTSQSGGVKLKYGGDVHAIRNRYQCVHDLLLWGTEATSQSFIICIQLWRVKWSKMKQVMWS